MLQRTIRFWLFKVTDTVYQSIFRYVNVLLTVFRSTHFTHIETSGLELFLCRYLHYTSLFIWWSWSFYEGFVFVQSRRDQHHHRHHRNQDAASERANAPRTNIARSGCKNAPWWCARTNASRTHASARAYSHANHGVRMCTRCWRYAVSVPCAPCASLLLPSIAACSQRAGEQTQNV